MAKAEKDSNKIMSGKVGALTYYVRGGKQYVRQSITKNKSHSTKQVRQRSRFQVCLQSLSPLKEAFREGFASQIDGARTAFNAGISANMSRAIKTENGNHVIDWSLVRCSQGSVPGVENLLITGTLAQGYTLNWTTAEDQWNARNDDNICLLCYDTEDAPAPAKFFGRDNAIRKDGAFRFRLPKTMSGHKIEVYVFTVRADSPEASETCYYGQLEID